MALFQRHFPSRSNRRLTILAFAAGLCAAPFVLRAAPLDKNSCAKLALDLQNMKSLDVDKLMEKGPSWASSHLSPGDLNLVRQYIDLDEQMKFRCSAPGSLVHLKHLDEEDDDSGSKPAVEAADGETEASKPPAAKDGNAATKQTAAQTRRQAKPAASTGAGDSR